MRGGDLEVAKGTRSSSGNGVVVADLHNDHLANRL